MDLEGIKGVATFESIKGYTALSTLAVTALSFGVNIAITLLSVVLRDIIIRVRCLTAFDAAFQIFIHVFVRMKQMRRLNLFRSNCVYVVFAVYKLLLRVKTNVFL